RFESWWAHPYFHANLARGLLAHCAVRRYHALLAVFAPGGRVGVRAQLVALAQLGRLAASTQEPGRELKDIPNQVAELRQSVVLLETLLAKERSELQAAQTLREQQDNLIKEDQDGIARAKAKSAKAKNAREAEAVDRELETIRRNIKD